MQEAATERYLSIDSATTKDVDDALSFAVVDGVRTLRVAIADVADGVAIGSEEDAIAYRQGATTYIRDFAKHPMLPRRLSEDKLSLTSGQKKNVMLFTIAFNEDASIAEFDVQQTRVRVVRAISYPEVYDSIQNSVDPDSAVLSELAHLAKQLLDQRRAAGALAFYDLSRLVYANEEGRLQRADSVKDTIGQIIVQESMILINTLAARFMVERDIPLILRNHQAKAAAPNQAEMVALVESLLRASALNVGKATDQLDLIAGRAEYSGVALGHYGLNLSAYCHLTSPIRRYADLVNQRQLKAHLNHAPLPYSQEDISEIASNLNVTLDARKSERSAGFKLAVERRAEVAVRAGDLSRLADHELVKAINLSEGDLPAIVSDEVVSRFQSGAVSDKIADAVFALPKIAATQPVREALLAWLVKHPYKSLHLIFHGQQVGLLADWVCAADGPAGEFTSNASVTKLPESQRFEGNGRGKQKREAEQDAAISVIAEIIGQSRSDHTSSETEKINRVSPASSSQVVFDSSVNYKGKLMEMCQKFRCAPPTFAHSSSGPPHLPTFACQGTLTTANQTFVGVCKDAKSKREAEARVCKQIIEQWDIKKAQSKASMKPTFASTNPIGELMERTQKQGAASPTFLFKEISSIPPVFECRISVKFKDDEARNAVGRGDTKQAAKAAAAQEVLNGLPTNH